jgi:flagellar basal body-associated protein FliL
MKKLIAMILVLAMAVAMTACGNKAADKAALAGTMEENAMKIMEIAPVEFMAGPISVNLEDTTEDGKWAVSYFTGMQDAAQATEACVYEPMMGSQAFSLVLVRTAEGVDPKAVAQEMKDNIDPRKWICVAADEIMVAGYGDAVMLVMVDSQMGLSAQTYVDAFKTVCGAELDFTI